MTNASDAIHPITERVYVGGVGTEKTTIKGLTKRELFASMAMQAMLSRSATFAPAHESDRLMRSDMAETAVLNADALIVALNEVRS